MDAEYSRVESQTTDLRSALELHYPHIINGLLKAWPNIESADRYLNSVLVDDRDSRAGLPEEAFAELMFLSDLNWKRSHFNQDGVQVSADSFSFGGPF